MKKMILKFTPYFDLEGSVPRAIQLLQGYYDGLMAEGATEIEVDLSTGSDGECCLNYMIMETDEEYNKRLYFELDKEERRYRHYLELKAIYEKEGS